MDTGAPSGPVLVIDDSPTVLNVVEVALSKAGIPYEIADDGSAGLAIAMRSTPSLVVMDHLMRGMTVRELSQAMAQVPALSRVPLVVMSTRGLDAGDGLARAENVVDTITKPFAPEAFLAVVKHALARSGQVREAPSPAAEALAGAASSADALPTGEVALRGNLAVISLPEVLILLQQQGHTGCLRVSRAPAQVDVFVRGGLVDFASAVGVGDEYLLGKYLVRAGFISEETLEQVLIDRKARPSTVPLLGGDLIERRMVNGDQLMQALARQTSELVFETLLWDTGAFELRVGSPSPSAAAQARLGLPADVLVIEGLRRVDEWRLIERAIRGFDTIFVRNEARVTEMANGKLTRDEIAILELVNGRNSVREVVRQSRMGSFEAARVLYCLLRANLVRPRTPPVMLG